MPPTNPFPAVYTPKLSDGERQAADPKGLGSGVLDPSLGGLAREIAQDIRPLEEILLDYGFTGQNDPRWLAVRESPAFGTLLAQSIEEWNSAKTTRQRIRLKAAAIVEQSLPTVFTIINDTTEKAADRIRMLEVVGRFANIDAETKTPQTNGGFAVTININPGDGTSPMQVRVVGTGPAEEQLDEGSDERSNERLDEQSTLEVTADSEDPSESTRLAEVQANAPAVYASVERALQRTLRGEGGAGMREAGMRGAGMRGANREEEEEQEEEEEEEKEREEKGEND